MVNAIDAAAAPYAALMLAVFLLSLRVTPVFLFTPLLQAFSVPPTVRVLLVAGLCLGLSLGIDAAQWPDPGTLGTGRLLQMACTELALGVTLALGVIVAFACVSMAGRMCDLQIGFGMAQVFDPSTRRQVPVLQAGFDKLAAVVFFLVDGHHALLRGIIYSLDRFPVGRAWALQAAVPSVIKQVASLFGLGLALAAPVALCLLLAELALGVMARNLPQMNMFVIGAPVKIIAGLAALSLWIAGSGQAMNRVYGSIYSSWDAIFSAAPPQGVR